MTQKFTGWRKSLHSEANDSCVEVGRSENHTVGVRDTKANGTGPILEFTRAEWAAFTLPMRKTGCHPANKA